MAKHINLHEVNKYLKNHNVSKDDFDIMMEDERFTTPRKPKQQRESYEQWKLRTGGTTNDSPITK